MKIACLSAPIFVWWDITYACNLKCKQCYSNAGRPAVNELATEEAKSLIRDLAQMKIFYIYFLGGEPLLRKDIFEIAEYAKDYGIEIMLSTNGWFMSPEIAARLRQIGFMHVRVSLDGATPKTHDSIRGVKESFNRAIRAIKTLQDARIPRVGISPTVLSENADELEDLINLAKNLGVNEMQLVQLCKSGRGIKALPPSDEQLTKVRKIFDDYREKFKGVLSLSATEGIDTDEILPNHQTSLPEFWGCPAGRTCAAIEAEGTVQPCILYGVEAGNIRKISFYEIWHTSPVFEKMRNITEDCVGCRYDNVCARNCPIESCVDNYFRRQFVHKSSH